MKVESWKVGNPDAPLRFDRDPFDNITINRDCLMEFEIPDASRCFGQDSSLTLFEVRINH
ncbi:MAG: hypothetical protein R3277_08785 [Brumimicrobium sp.]|nr:hypothetical protein [Brumimicrobium sp.]